MSVPSATMEPMTSHATLSTALGELDAVLEGERLRGVYFPGHWTRPDQGLWGERVDLADHPLFAEVQGQLEEYLRGERRGFDLPLALEGGELEREVWQVLRGLEYGETTTYGAIASRLGRPGAAQAVGRAVGHNPISVIVPCHRVLGSDGSLTGYAGGLERKRTLLELEGAIDAPLF